ncbi:hypothetical protein BH20ACT16_BH20ACT16_13330 [soil metagenome]|jgi:hypothetical protein
MDTHSEQLWRDGAPPFDGLTLWTPPLPAAGLCEALEVIVSVLESYVEQRALQTAEDWHEHDGYISMAYEATWDQLVGAFSDEAALRRSSPGDDLVRRAWRDQNDVFYLRWFLYDDDDDVGQDDAPGGGEADLTAARAIVDAAARQLAEIGLDVEVGPARDFFVDRWGG